MVDAGDTGSGDSNRTGSTSNSGDSIVDSILGGERQSVFADKSLVDSTTIVDHDRIYGRDEQLAAEARAFKDTLEGERPPDLLLYGPSGTGKSLTVKSVAEKVKQRARESGISFDYVAVNFKTMESYTLDRAVWKLGRQTAKQAGVQWNIPQKGVSTDEKYVRLYDIVDNHFDALVFILDEIDALTGRSDEPAYSRLLYSLSRVMSEQHVETLISTVVITNNPKFRQNLDSRSDSSYNPNGVHFSDYAADELREILERRKDAFKDGALNDGVIRLVAAYGARNEGDARRAIDLLRDAGEIADTNGDPAVTESHVRSANDSVVKNRVLEMVRGASLHKKLTMYAAAIVADVNDGAAPSPAVYKLYKSVCQKLDVDMYTQETVNSHINKAETYGLLEKERVSGGYKAGVYLLFRFNEPVSAVIETIEEDPLFEDVSSAALTETAGRLCS